MPVVSVTSGMSQWLVIGGLIMGAAAGVGMGYWVAVAGLVFMGAATLFSFITLPIYSLFFSIMKSYCVTNSNFCF